MATALNPRRATANPADTARLHFVLRFSFGTTAAFIACEWMGWQPSSLAAVLTAVLLANLQASPPPKVGFALVLIMALPAYCLRIHAVTVELPPREHTRTPVLTVELAREIMLAGLATCFPEECGN